MILFQNINLKYYPIKSIGIFIMLLYSTSSFCTQSLNLVLNSKPQSQYNTCQSYALAFSLMINSSIISDREIAKKFSEDTINKLRTIEKKLSSLIETVAREKNKSKYEHAIWQEAISRITSGQLLLKLEYIDEPSKFYLRVKEITGISNAEQLGLVLSTIMLGNPVMTSVKSVEGSSYQTGHIVTILGLGENFINNQSVSENSISMLILNSAVKNQQGSMINICHQDPGDDRYTASAFIAKKYELNKFEMGNKKKYFLLMYLLPNLSPSPNLSPPANLKINP